MGKITVAYCIDEKYKPLAEVSIKTLRKHNKNIKVVVVSESPIPVLGADEYYIFNLGGQHRNRGHGDRITNASYLKLCLPNLPYDKIIYLDADTIIQKSLDEIWRKRIKYIGVTESHKYGNIQAKELGLKKYALAGFMVMNLKNLRGINFTEESFKFEKNNNIPDNLWRHEESILNSRWSDKLTFIPVKYHYCHNRAYKKPIPENEAFILHIVGRDKKNMYKYDT